MIAARAEGVKPSIHFHFIAVPVELLARTDLSPAAKLLAGVVLDSARGSRAGSCKLSNAALGARIGLSAASAKRLLAELEAAGVVRRETIADGRIRTAIRPTWVDQIRSTEQASAGQIQPTGGADPIQGVDRGRATIQILCSEPGFQTGPILSTPGGEKNQPEPKPSPEEIAIGIRAMIAGTFSPELFGPTSHPSNPKGDALPCPASRQPDAPVDPTRGVRLDPGRLMRDARRAAYARPQGARKKTAAEQIAELRRRSAERERQEAAQSPGIGVAVHSAQPRPPMSA